MSEEKNEKQETLEEVEKSEEEKVEEIRKQLEESQDRYLRLLAESENSRKRMHKEREEQSKFSKEGILLDILHPIDQMEQALHFAEQMSDEVRNWAIGFQMILGQFKEVLSKNHVEGFDATGEKFDPHLHEAVETLESEEHEEGVVTKQFLKGYKIGERVIRPARVQVAAPKKSEEKEENKKEESTHE